MLPRRYTARAARWCARGGPGGAGRRAAAALLALAALALAGLRVPLPHRYHNTVALPGAPPHKVAAHLADFNNLHKLYRHIESWRIKEQWSNYTSWRYSLEWSCGARCAGRGAVLAQDEYPGAAPAHGRAARHRVRVDLATCRTLPLLPWPAFCEELEVEWQVAGDGAGGTRLQEAGAAHAALALALPGWLRGRGAGEPAAAQDTHLAALRAAFP